MVMPIDQQVPTTFLTTPPNGVIQMAMDMVTIKAVIIQITSLPMVHNGKILMVMDVATIRCYPMAIGGQVTQPNVATQMAMVSAITPMEQMVTNAPTKKGMPTRMVSVAAPIVMAMVTSMNLMPFPIIHSSG